MAYVRQSENKVNSMDTDKLDLGDGIIWGIIFAGLAFIGCGLLLLADKLATIFG